MLGLAPLRVGNAALAQTDNETAGATSNATPVYTDVVLQLNPEYDNPLGYREPTLLVMLEGKFTGIVPSQVSFLVPTNSGMYSAGSRDAQGNYSGGPPDRTASSIPGWDVISYRLQSETFRVEYYDTQIVSGFPDRTISYDFRTLVPVTGMHVVVQQPRRATGFTANLTGATPTVATDSEGFTVYSYFVDEVSPSQPLHIDVSYSKPDAEPSIADAATSTGGGSSNTGMIAGIAAGVIVLAGVTVWLLKSRQPRYAPAGAPRAERRRRAREGGPAAGGAPAGGGGRFCTACGQRINPSDRFCPYCGARTGG
jgi:hypothetical protein